MGKAKEKNHSGRTMADRADRHELYEAAVQNVAEECSLIDFVFKQIRGRKARTLREDFCGTASTACEWVTLGSSRHAFGIDVDPEVLEWGRKHRVRALKKKQRERISLIHGDVLTAEAPLVDVIVAFNFSYWVFEERARLLRYFKRVLDGLESDGIFFLDAYGGPSAFTECKERSEMDGFTYVWQQARYSPVTGRMKTHIHFEFADVSKLKRAFSYEWRLWTVPEIRDLLGEAGFRKVTVWFELRDENGEGVGEWFPDPDGPAEDPTWIANITAEK